MEEGNSKQKDHEFGKFAENVAAEYYLKQGYVIKERNWRLRHIEIDVIAQTDNIIVFVEVKARKGNVEDAISAVTSEKRKRMVRAADYYLKSLNGDYEYRYDIFALSGDITNYEYEVIEDAFLSPLR